MRQDQTDHLRAGTDRPDRTQTTVCLGAPAKRGDGAKTNDKTGIPRGASTDDASHARQHGRQPCRH